MAHIIAQDLVPSIWCSEGAAPTAGPFPTCEHGHSIIIAARCSLCTHMAFSNVTPTAVVPGPGKPVESWRHGLRKGVQGEKHVRRGQWDNHAERLYPAATIDYFSTLIVSIHLIYHILP